MYASRHVTPYRASAGDMQCKIIKKILSWQMYIVFFDSTKGGKEGKIWRINKKVVTLQPKTQSLAGHAAREYCVDY